MLRTRPDACDFCFVPVSVQCHPYIPHLLATGCYDECLRLWDTRNMRVPVRLCGVSGQCGGGVWRVKWHPDPKQPRLVLVSCMRGGSFVVDTGMNGGDQAGVVLRPCIQPPTSHASSEALAYGIDWLTHRGPMDCISCTYYNRNASVSETMFRL